MDLGVENQPNIDQKSIQKVTKKRDANLDESWRALGGILGGFWPQVGEEVGAKLAPKCKK